jgi:hypothetical protein
MTPKAVAFLGVCVMAPYIAFAAWVYNSGVVYSTAVILYLQHRFNIGSDTLSFILDNARYTPYVGAALLVIAWLQSKGRMNRWDRKAG